MFYENVRTARLVTRLVRRVSESRTYFASIEANKEDLRLTDYGVSQKVWSKS
jgi:hypothetical protein